MTQPPQFPPPPDGPNGPYVPQYPPPTDGPSGPYRPQYPPPPGGPPGGPGSPYGSQYPPPPGGPYGPQYSPGDPYGVGPKPASYLVWSILTTLFCCLPFGIVSIVQAAKVDGLWTAGDYAGARAASASAKKWAIIAAAVGVGLAVIYVIAAIGIASSSNGPNY
jgi:hypothetical protein